LSSRFVWIAIKACEHYLVYILHWESCESRGSNSGWCPAGVGPIEPYDVVVVVAAAAAVSVLVVLVWDCW